MLPKLEFNNCFFSHFSKTETLLDISNEIKVTTIAIDEIIIPLRDHNCNNHVAIQIKFQV